MGSRKTTPPNSPVEMYEAIARIDAGVTSIKEDLLPPVTKAANEAKVGVVQLRERDKVTRARLKTLETAPPPIHAPCELINEASQKVSAQDRDIAGLSKWRWWLMGLIATAVIIGGGWAVSSASDMATVQTQSTGIRSDVDRHEGSIKAIEAARVEDRDKIISAVRAVPGKVKIPEPDLDDALDEQPELSDRDRALIQSVLDRAKRRNGGHR